MDKKNPQKLREEAGGRILIKTELLKDELTFRIYWINGSPSPPRLMSFDYEFKYSCWCHLLKLRLIKGILLDMAILSVLLS